MPRKTINLTEIPSGYFLTWQYLTQAYNHSSVKLEAGEQLFFDKSKTNNVTDLQVIAHGSGVYTSKSPLTLTIETTPKLEIEVVSGAIHDSNVNKVGYSYSFAIEDWDDNDYNDVYINIMAWAKQG
ncbi:MAG: hypothetical protein FWC91_02865 [Defluviitaleaceae bacterium]|nr:hypothetical protein [Defluviitaleaceae bacterium]